MWDQDDDLLFGMSRSTRFWIGIGLLGIPVVMAKMLGGGPLGALAVLVASIPFLVVGALFIAPTVGMWMGRPFGNLFYPEDYYKVPPPIKGPAQALARQGRFEEALKECERVLKEYPDTYDLWELMIEVLLRDLRDRSRAQDVLDRALENLDDPEKRRELRRRFDELIPVCEGPPEHRPGRIDLIEDSGGASSHGSIE